MSDSRHDDRPSAFIAEWLTRAKPLVPARGRALDVATGRGRHAVPMARAGYTVFVVDINFDAVRDAMARAARNGVVRGWVADLTRSPLPPNSFDLIVVTRYLQRDLFPALRDALVPGGVVLYETFTEAQRGHGVGPKSPDHLLRAGELRERFKDSSGFEIVFEEEVLAPEAVARIVARRRT